MDRINPVVLAFLALVLQLTVPRAAHAAESYDNCTGFIASVPAIIATQGTWCLKQDLTTPMTSGNAITISTNNVTIDCNDFKLGGLSAGKGTQTNGIFALDRLNVAVRHCNIRGFYYGVDIHGSGVDEAASGGHTIEDNRLDGNTGYGIVLGGDGSVVRRNRVFDTGGSTVLPSAAEGINASHSVDVLDNTVSGVTALTGQNGSVVGIAVVWNHDGSISGNRVRGLLADGTGSAYGIFVTDTGHLALRKNDVVGNGSAGSVGLSCAGANSQADDNVVSGFAIGINGCSDDGNVIAP